MSHSADEQTWEDIWSSNDIQPSFEDVKVDPIDKEEYLSLSTALSPFDRSNNAQDAFQLKVFKTLISATHRYYRVTSDGELLASEVLKPLAPKACTLHGEWEQTIVSAEEASQGRTSILGNQPSQEDQSDHGSLWGSAEDLAGPNGGAVRIQNNEQGQVDNVEEENQDDRQSDGRTEDQEHLLRLEQQVESLTAQLTIEKQKYQQLQDNYEEIQTDREHYRKELRESRERAAQTDEWEAKYTENLRQYNELFRQYQARQSTIRADEHSIQQLQTRHLELERALEAANDRRKEDEDLINQYTLDIQAYRRDTNALHRRVTELRLEVEEFRMRASYETNNATTHQRAHSPMATAKEECMVSPLTRAPNNQLALTYPSYSHHHPRSDPGRESYYPHPRHPHLPKAEEAPTVRAPTRGWEDPDDFYRPARGCFDQPMNTPTTQYEQRATNQNKTPMSEVSQVVGQVLNFIEKQNQRPQGYEDAVKGALKISHGITILTTKALRQGDNRGVQALNKYIGQVEQRCPLESMRVALIPLTVETELLKRLKLDGEALKTTSWTEFKQLLMAKLPKVRPCDAETRILQMRMTKQDDIEEFTARIRKEYEETCQLLGVEELGTPLNEVLEVTITGDMTLEGKTMFGRALRRDPDTAIGMIEEAFREKAYREKVFAGLNQSSILGGPRTRSSGGQVSFAQAPNADQVQNTPLTTYTINQTPGPRSQTPPPALRQQPSSQAPRPQRPFQGTARGAGISSGRERGESDIYSWAQKRRDMLNTWRDWVCSTCHNLNAGGFFTCGTSDCTGRAASHQIPQASWQCPGKVNERPCGQNVWTGDHFCYGCLGPNPDIHPNSLRTLPAECKPRTRAEQTWYENSPAIEP